MANKKKGKFEFEVEYRVEAMISVSVNASSEQEAKEMIDEDDTHPKFGEFTAINDSTIKFVGIRNMSEGWNKFNQ